MAETLNPSKSARIAAALYFFGCIPLYFWEQSATSKIFEANDPVATAGNLLANEFVFRFATVTHLAGNIIFALMILIFCRIFRPVDKHLTRLMAFFIVVNLPMVFVQEIFNIGALMTLKSETRPTFDVSQQQETAYFLLRMGRYVMGTSKLLLGLSFIPFGMVILKSGFAPRIIGILVLTGAAGYVADFCIYVLLQRPDYLMVRSIIFYIYPSWMIALLWFLIKGVREPQVIVT